MNGRQRRAVVTGGRSERTLAEVVARYLPANYEVVKSTWSPDGFPQVVIEGVDSQGWSLDGYVIPRLASGLYSCEEVTHDDAR